MEINSMEDGSYIVAVSGGVDSMVLLNLLHGYIKTQPSVKIIVGHVDHGIRSDSALDRQLVEVTCVIMGLPFYYTELKLGPSASEADARLRRYEFLDDLADRHEARAVITAHHQDDLIETVIMNILRGTNRKGLSPMINTERRIRPLLTYSKQELTRYAEANNIKWREDSTNKDTNYLRNYVRARIIPRLDYSARSQLLNIINSMAVVNVKIDQLVEDFIKNAGLKAPLIDRQWFNQLPHIVSKEIMASWLRANGIRDFDSKTLERLVVKAKVGKENNKFPILKGYNLELKDNYLALAIAER
jgi:tRNA(Ile)-lysidine synthetase-like protein